MDDNNDKSVLPDSSESMETVTTYDKESLIGKVFPEILTDEGTVKSDASSISIDYDNFKVRVKGMPKITPEQEKELEDFLNEQQLSFKSGDGEMDTQQVLDEIEELLKNEPVVSTEQAQGDAAAGTGDGANNQPQPPQPGPINVPITNDELIAAINATDKYVDTETKVETNDDGILVTVQNKPNQGGKSKKKQMKPKNKSNKKMKKKQTKKGGKQIKKRSLKHKMKK
tara:strand:- start:1812 stop:2492 length:681 start_codon:yes stop_codon:yes gene_type:complete